MRYWNRCTASIQRSNALTVLTLRGLARDDSLKGTKNPPVITHRRVFHFAANA